MVLQRESDSVLTRIVAQNLVTRREQQEWYVPASGTTGDDDPHHALTLWCCFCSKGNAFERKSMSGVRSLLETKAKNVMQRLEAKKRPKTDAQSIFPSIVIITILYFKGLVHVMTFAARFKQQQSPSCFESLLLFFPWLWWRFTWTATH